MTGDAAPPRTPGPASVRSGDGLLLRVISAAVLAPLAVAAAYAGGWPFALFWGAAAVAIAYEWLTLTASGRPALAIGLAALLIAAALAVIGKAVLGAAMIACGTAAVALIAAAARRTSREAALTAAWTAAWIAAGVLYAGAALVPPVVLRADTELGFTAIIFLFAIVWTTDIAAYFVGRGIGGPRLWPAVSPNKTWSGALGGALGAVAAACAVASIGLRTGYRANLFAIAGLALLLSAMSQVGDLFESAVKRRFGVKDAGHVIPGHGGVMDRLDGFLAAAVVAAVIGIARGGLGAPARGLLVW